MFTKKIIGIFVLAIICIVGIGSSIFLLNRTTETSEVDETNGSMVFQKEKNDLKLSDANFVVMYSDAMKEGAEIVTYGSKGEILDKKKLGKGRALYYATEANGDYFITSERQNHHYQLKESGAIVSFFGPANYDKDRSIGSSFVRSTDEYLFFTMNIGSHPTYSPEEYSNELVYWNYKKNMYNNIKLAGYFQSVVAKDDKAYVLYVDSPVHTVGIYVIDLATNKLLYDYPIDSHKSQQNDEEYYPTGQYNASSLQLFHNQLIVLLDGNRPQIQNRPIMQIINPLNGTLEKEISISREQFPLYASMIHGDKLYLISDDNQVVMLSQDFQIHEQAQLEQGAAFIQKREEERGFMSGTQIVGDSIYVLYDFVKNEPSARDREIRKYDLQTGKEEQVIPLSNQSEKEIVRFFALPASK